jgi:hypothetical protein
MREKRIFLENGIEFPLVGRESGYVFTVKKNLSGVWRFKPA